MALPLLPPCVLASRRRSLAASGPTFREGPLDRRLALDPVAQLRAAAGGDRPGGAPLAQRDAATTREVEQLLALPPLAGGGDEQPAEQAQGHDRPLDHHDRPAGDLVGDRLE